MKCEYCDNEVPAGAKHCPSCGGPVKPSAAPQPQPQQVFTQQPAYAQPQPQFYAPGGMQQIPYTPKIRVAYIILALLFGALGIHNFYAGRVGCGIAQLLITLFIGWLILPLLAVGLWVFIEMLAVTTDGRGVRFQ